MIPKVLHLIWFGKKEKNALILECISSWKKTMPLWKIKEWDEENYSLEKAPQWVQTAYSERKWAFVSDYARIDILEKEGGVYLDTDMYMVRSLDSLCTHSLFIGKEDSLHLSAGVIGSIAHHPFMSDVLTYYWQSKKCIPIPKVLTEVFNTHSYSDIFILDALAFYPFSQQTISKFNKKNAPTDSYSVHMWNYSWGPWYARALHSLPVYHSCKKILTRLGVKDVLKKILKLP